MVIMGFLWSIDNSEETKLMPPSLFYSCFSHSFLFYRFADVNRQIPVYFRLISTLCAYSTGKT